MRKYIVIATIILLLSVIALVRARIAPYHQQRNPSRNESVPFAKQKKLTQAEFESQFPIVEYAASEPEITVAKAKEVSAEKRYNKGQLPVSEYSERIITHSNWEVGLPALPVSQSQAIVLARVVNAQAHLTSDKAVVYSEFLVQVDEILKDSNKTLTPNSLLTVTRSGGRVRFPSGHITLQSIAGQNMPRVGEKYVFFLTRDNAEEDFHLLTGYEFHAGRVYPIDNPQGGTHPIATTYNDIEQKLFFADLHAAIISAN